MVTSVTPTVQKLYYVAVTIDSPYPIINTYNENYNPDSPNVPRPGFISTTRDGAGSYSLLVKTS